MLPCTGWLIFKLLLPGIAWSGLVPYQKLVRDDDRLSLWVLSSSTSLILGFAMHLLMVLLLAELGIYTALAETLGTIVLILMGLTFSCKAGLGSLKRNVVLNAPGTVLLVLSFSAAMLNPKCSEWLMGGLDPGVYQNQGIHMAETGTFHPEPEAFYSELSEEDLTLFTRGDGDYREFMPGIPISIENRSVQHYFFRLTPVFTASMMRSGGLEASLKTNYFAGIMAVLLFWGLLIANGAGRPWQMFALILLLIQPIFLYQLHVATSEMLHLTLILGIGFMLSMRREGFVVPVFLGLLFFAAVLNRLSFMPFAGLFICGIAWIDMAREDRGRVLYERMAMLMGLLGGIIFDLTVCKITIERLQKPMPIMIAVAIVTVAVALLLDAAFVRKRVRTWCFDLNVWAYRAILAGVLLFLLLLWENGKKMGMEDAYNTFHSLSHFLGRVFIIFAIPGAVALYWVKRRELAVIRMIIAVMLAVTMIVMTKSFVHGSYPWAVRRFLAYTVPAIAILIGYFLSVIWNSRRWNLYAMRSISIIALLVLLGGTVKISWHAFNRVEYMGITKVLSDIAAQIQDNDIVVIDTPTWGTPLKFTYGRTIVNGKHLWRRKSAEGMTKALVALNRARENGARVRFLTTTRTAAMDIYPVKLTDLTLDFETDEINLEEINHSRRGDDFEVRTTANRFRLYTWGGSIPDGRSPKTED